MGRRAPVHNRRFSTQDVGGNTGFADLGTGFYLTDSHEAARGRARGRARVNGTGRGVVSVYGFDPECVRWVTWGAQGPVAQEPVAPGPAAHAPAGGYEPSSRDAFALKFDASLEGIAAWADYISACRSGRTAVPGFGEPAIVQAWIATEEIEMVCSGMVSGSDMAEFIDPAALVVQYCFRDQALLDASLRFQGSEDVSQS